MKTSTFLTGVALAAVGCTAAASSAAAGAAAPSARFNLQPPVTDIARQVYGLHDMMLIICALIFVSVFSVMFYSIWKYRKSRGAKAANFHENTTVEVIWTIIPFFIIIVMALPATRTVVAMKDTSNADLTIKVTGYQWKWGYDYIRGEGEGISYLSQLATPRAQIDGAEPKDANYLLAVTDPMVVPVNKKVRIITTAADVIHAWWIPAFGVKQDAIPGFARDAWFRAEKTGTYYGQCAELCGKDHAFMPTAVKVVSAEEYSAWVAERMKTMTATADDPTRTWEREELITRGARVYQANCQPCHQANGEGVKGSFPALAGSKAVANTAEQIHVILNGRNAMPAWRTLSDVELAAVATYEKNAFGNKGGIVQPSEFTAARK